MENKYQIYERASRCGKSVRAPKFKSGDYIVNKWTGGEIKKVVNPNIQIPAIFGGGHKITIEGSDEYHNPGDYDKIGSLIESVRYALVGCGVVVLVLIVLAFTASHILKFFPGL